MALPAEAHTHAPILHFHSEEGAFCCFPSSAEEVLDDARMGRIGERRQPKSLIPPPPIYVDCERAGDGSVIRVKYWFWYLFNDFPQGPGPIGSHSGDWESVEVLLQNGTSRGYFLSNHHSARYVKAGESVRRQDGRVNVWVGKGSHAHYERPSNIDVYCILGFCDQIDDVGLVLDTQATLTDVTETNFWRQQYQGDWGDGAGIHGPPRRRIDEHGWR